MQHSEDMEKARKELFERIKQLKPVYMPGENKCSVCSEKIGDDTTMCKTCSMSTKVSDFVKRKPWVIWSLGYLLICAFWISYYVGDIPTIKHTYNARIQNYAKSGQLGTNQKDIDDSTNHLMEMEKGEETASGSFCIIGGMLSLLALCFHKKIWEWLSNPANWKSSSTSVDSGGANRSNDLTRNDPGSINYEHQNNHIKLRCKKCHNIGCKVCATGSNDCPFIKFDIGRKCMACGSSDTETFH